MKMGIVVLAVVIIAILAVGGYLISMSYSKSRGSTVTYSSTAYTSSVQSQSSSIAQSSTIPAARTASTTIPGVQTQSYTVVMENSTTLGSYLANASGFTLYTYSGDTPNSGDSTCYSSCAANWPVFYGGNLSVAPGLNASNFGTITRTDGTKQTTYKGWPLYFFVADHSPGEVNGNNVGGFNVAKV